MRSRLLLLPSLLRTLSLILLVIALARPRQGIERVRNVSKGIAVEMIIDRSSSMGAMMKHRGGQLNRLETSKQIFEEFINGNDDDLPGRPNDLIGMVTFARYPDTICPLTLAHGALTEFLRSVKMVERGSSEDATAIGDAVALAAARLKTAEHTLKTQLGDTEKSYEIKSKIIIVLTDGQNNAGRSPLQAARLAAKWDIKVYTIAVGAAQSSQPIQGLLGAFQFPTQQPIDHATLQKMAEETGGIYRVADDAQSLRAIYEEIDQLEKSEIETLSFTDYREGFTPFAVAALALLCLEVLLNCTAFRKLP
jgi:Ca-activated chloride channel family protein